MSKETRDRVWAHSRMSASALVLLLALAERADSGGVCWPGHEWLQQHSRVGKRMVQKLLNQLEAAGEILTPTSFGRGNEPTYVVTVGWNEAVIACVLTSHTKLDELRGLKHSPAKASELARAVCARRNALKSIPDESEPGDQIEAEKVNDHASFRRGQKVNDCSPFEEIKGEQSFVKRCTIVREKVNDRSQYYKEEPSLNRKEPSDDVRAVGASSSPPGFSKSHFPNGNGVQKENGAAGGNGLDASEEKRRRAVLRDAVLEALEASVRWQMGTVSDKFRRHVVNFVQSRADVTTPEDVRRWRENLPIYFGRDPATFSKPTLNQLLDTFDSVLSFADQNAGAKNGGSSLDDLRRRTAELSR